MAEQGSKKGKGNVKIDDLKQKPLTKDEEDSTKGGLSTGGVIFRPPSLGGGTVPRADVTHTTDDDLD